MKVMKDSLKYIGLVFSFRENEEDEGKLSETGVVAKIVQASKQANAPLQVVVQVMERFEIVKLQKEKPVIQARVRYWYDSDPGSEEELKAYSVSIINAIKELVQLNPLFKEELGLLMGRVNLNEMPPRPAIARSVPQARLPVRPTFLPRMKWAYSRELAAEDPWEQLQLVMKPAGPHGRCEPH